MVRLSLYLLLLPLVMSPLCAWGQTEDNRVITGIDATFFDYKAIPTQQYFNPQNFNPGVRLSANIYLSGLLNYSIASSFVPRASYPLPNGQYTPQLLIDVNTGFQFKANNGKILKKEAVVAPYLYTGIGFSTSENKNGLYVPAALGIRFRVSDKVSLNYESMYRQKLKETPPQAISHSIGVIFVVANPKPKTKPEPIAKKDKTPPPPKKENSRPVITFKPQKDEPQDEPQNEPKDEPIVTDNPTPIKPTPKPAALTPRPKPTTSEPIVTDDDRDGDGVSNDQDICPDEFGEKANIGCPDWKKIPQGQEVANLTENKNLPDRDGDGIRDDLDGCPDQAAPRSQGGCPPFLAIAKTIDKEIDRSEVYNKMPETAPAIAQNTPPVTATAPKSIDPEPAILERLANPNDIAANDIARLNEIGQLIKYKPKSSQIDPNSVALIAEIQAIISKYPNYKLVIMGYYGEDQDEEENKILSVTRAFEIKRQLLFTQNQVFSKIETNGSGSEKVGRGKGRGKMELKLVPKN